MKKWIMCIGVVVSVAFAIIFSSIDKKISNEEDSTISINSSEQHIEAMENGADPLYRFKNQGPNMDNF